MHPTSDAGFLGDDRHEDMGVGDVVLDLAGEPMARGKSRVEHGLKAVSFEDRGDAAYQVCVLVGVADEDAVLIFGVQFSAFSGVR